MIDLLKIVYELTAGNFSQVSDVTYVPLVILLFKINRDLKPVIFV